jgi:hypothetical protein
MEQMFETAVALAEQGRTMFGGVPSRSSLRSSHASSSRKSGPPSRHAGSRRWRSHRWPGSPDAGPQSRSRSQGCRPCAVECIRLRRESIMTLHDSL